MKSVAGRQCVILAGGLGTRLQAVTGPIPKTLVPVNGRPFAAYQLALLARNEVSEVVYCIGHRGEQIVRAIGDGSAFGVRVRYVEDGPILRGTAGALRRAFDEDVLDEAFFVLYGDSYLPIAFPPVFFSFEANERAPLMTVLRNENRWDRSNVVYRAPRVALYDKRCDDPSAAGMTHIDYGLSVLPRNIIAEAVAPEMNLDLADLYKALSIAGRLIGFEVTQRFYEVGSPEGLTEFSRYATAHCL